MTDNVGGCIKKHDFFFFFYLVNVFISEKGSYSDCAVFYPIQHKTFAWVVSITCVWKEIIIFHLEVTNQYD